MRIAFDAHMIGERETGNESYALNLLRGLATLPDDDNTYAVLTPRPQALRDAITLPPRFEVVRVRPAASVLRIPLGMPLAIRSARADLLHVTYIAPPRPGCPTVVAVHDLSYLAHPEWLSWRVRFTLKQLVPRSVRAAARVIAISDFTKRDLVQRYGLPPEKIVVVPLAAGANVTPLPDAAALPLPAGIRDPFILAVGNLEPRKNLATLIEAFAELVRQHAFGGQLVIAGKAKYRGEGTAGVVARLGLEGRVTFTGFVDDATLRLLYNRAALFAYPSLYEGFGLPLLEAMACGCPVVASNATAIPQTAGDAAILVDPTSSAALTAAMARVLGDAELARRMSIEGKAQAARYSWTRTAELTRAVYAHALGHPRPDPPPQAGEGKVAREIQT
jgi:glycosyltransferase involved in cell wall biosynthesis